MERGLHGYEAGCRDEGVEVMMDEHGARGGGGDTDSGRGGGPELTVTGPHGPAMRVPTHVCLDEHCTPLHQR